MEVYILEKTVFNKDREEMILLIDVYENKVDAIDYLDSIGFHLNCDKEGYENNDKPEDYYRIILKTLIKNI